MTTTILSRLEEICDLEINTHVRTTQIAQQLTADTDRNSMAVMEIALNIAAQSGTILNRDELLNFVRNRLSHFVTNLIESDSNGKYNTIPGAERVGNGDHSKIVHNLGTGSDVRLYDDFISSDLQAGNIAVVNFLSALNVSPDSRRTLTDAILPKVVWEDGEWVLQKVNKEGGIVDLYRREDGPGHKLSEIITQRENKHGSYPAYSKAQFAIYLEAVLHSDMPQEAKNRFVDSLLVTRKYEEDIWYHRPRYDGGDYKRYEFGTRITLPTGKSLRINQHDEILLDSPSQHYSTDRSDITFVMALVERGRLPIKALDSIYKVKINDDTVYLSNIHRFKKQVTIDLSKPYDKKTDIHPITLSFLLNRDPRISTEDRLRLRHYFGNNIDLKVVPSEY